MKIGSLFTGYGGLDQAVTQVTGAETVWVSEIDKGACKILAHRYPNVPNLGDITQIDWTTVEPVDILTGGFPCQDVSHAGKRAGLKDGTRSGLWSYMAESIEALQPRLVVIENVRGLLSAASPSDVEPCPWCVGDEPTFDLRALGTVLADLADIGFDARWCGLRATDVGSCHGRFRVFLLAYPRSEHGIERWFTAPRETEGRRPLGELARRDRTSIGESQLKRNTPPLNAVAEFQQATFGDYANAISRWEQVMHRAAPLPTEIRPTGRGRLSPAFVEWMMGLSDGWVTEVPELSWAEQLKALGNGVVPQQAAAALRHLLEA